MLTMKKVYLFAAAMAFAACSFAQTVANRVLEITPNGVIDRYMTVDEYLDDEKVQELRKKMYN